MLHAITAGLLPNAQTAPGTKTKELVRLAIGPVLRRTHCMDQHTKAEVAEALLLASLQAAGAELNWGRELVEEHLDG